MPLSDLLPQIWAMRPESLRKAMVEASTIKSFGDEQAWSAPRSAAEAVSGERRPYRVENGLAVIPIQGSLIKEFHYPPFWTSYVVVRFKLETALADPEVRAILLDIDSPGGSVAGFLDLAEAVYAARSRKPVYAWTDGMACSAAYGIAAAATNFAASPTAEVGSVGVVWVHTEWTKYDERMGLTVTVLRAGEFKALGNEYEALDAKAREVHQATLDGMYELFRGLVAKCRGVSEKKFEDWAEGKVFLADEAVSVGLLDRACAKDEYLESIKLEVSMKVSDLRDQFPEAVKAIEDEAAKKVSEQSEKAVAESKGVVVELAGVLFGEEAKGKLQAAVEANLTPDQATKLGLAGQVGGQDQGGQDKSADILAALQSGDPSGVKSGTGAAKPGANPLMKAVKQMAGAKE